MAKRSVRAASAMRATGAASSLVAVAETGDERAGAKARRRSWARKRSVDQLKRLVRIEDLAAASGVTLERRGMHWVGACPFHPNSGAATLVLDPHQNTWWCEGACRTDGNAPGGTVVDWVMKRDRVSFVRAAETLHAFLGAGEQAERICVGQEPPASGEGAKPARRAVLAKSLADYRALIECSEAATEYVERWATGEDGTFVRAALDYVQWWSRLETKELGKLCSALEELGLLGDRSRFRGPLLVIVREKQRCSRRIALRLIRELVG